MAFLFSILASNSNIKPDTELKTNASILGKELRTLEERRKSLLDHHWAVPSKDR